MTRDSIFQRYPYCLTRIVSQLKPTLSIFVPDLALHMMSYMSLKVGEKKD